MWRRLALVIALTALTGLAAASWIRIHQVVRDRNDIVTDRITGRASRVNCAGGCSSPTRWCDR
jgi:hypothetical protein